MHGHRKVGDDIHRARGRSSTCAERDRQSGVETVGRERNHEPQRPRDNRSPLPRQLPQNLSVSRFDARHSRADGGHPGILGRECRDYPGTYGSRRDRRSRERTADDRRERETERARGSRGAEDRFQKKRKIGGYRVQGNSVGWEDKHSTAPQATVQEEKEIEKVEEKQEAEAQSFGEQSEREPEHRAWKQQQRGEHQFGRFRSPLPQASPFGVGQCLQRHQCLPLASPRIWTVGPTSWGAMGY